MAVFQTMTGIANMRLVNQLIAENQIHTAGEIVGSMGAMQAQDLNMAKLAVGIRMPASTEETIDTAIDEGEILRTHLLRPTWHFVASEDIRWMLELTAPRIRAVLTSRHKELQLTTSLLVKSNKVIEKALSFNNHLTREELVLELNNAKIATNNNRSSHLLLWAELDGLICSGKSKAKKYTYALLDERVPKTKSINREDALKKLAMAYFSSHGPATLQDFIWWSGLSVKDAKNALEIIKPDFINAKIASQTYWFKEPASTISSHVARSVYLLPAFDEYIISYKDRSAVLNFENHRKAVSNNGLFRPVIVVNGVICGIWKRILKKNVVAIETELFIPQAKNVMHKIEQRAFDIGRFLNREMKITHKST